MANTLPLALRERAGIIASVALILFLTMLSTFASPVNAEKSIVTVFADGNERVISTAVLTVGEALERAGVELGDQDLVEPGLETVINEAVFRVNVYRARPITVVDGNSQKTILTPYKSPARIAESAGVTVYPEDEYTFELIDDILLASAVGQRLTIDRATPVTISLYGEELVHRTQLETVGEVLEEAGVVLGTSDEVSTNLTAAVSEKVTIGVVRTGTEVITENVPIPFEIETILDSNKFVGQTDVQKPGVLGSAVVTYEIELKNGVEVARREIQRVVETKPVAEIQVKGSQQPVAGTVSGTKAQWLSASNIPEQYWTQVDYIVTKESTWNPNAVNPSSGACGLGQQLPCGKWPGEWNDPIAALNAMNNYVNGRYGGWGGAYSFWVENSWY